ncbi:Gp15 family bacteriophage protein [Paenibacillus sp. FSL L8-0708]|uniref:Gp15 family bacteriophage protein n=1 Tax=Paenibacillus sp. FSL L8-0708 TaxID=2975311 RepID=UPI0030FC429D
MKRLPSDFNSDESVQENWYDLREDWALIEASLAKQYGIRIRQHGNMPFSEFCTLVTGLMPDTPLGSIVTIRSEKDPKVRRGFSKEQRRIYNEWRNRKAEDKLADPDMLNQEFKGMEAMLTKMFGGGGA